MRAALTAAGVQHAHMSKVHLFELFVGCFVGAITFTASVFAFYGKLAAKKWAKTISGAWVKPVQALIFVAMLACGFYFFYNWQHDCFLGNDRTCTCIWLGMDCTGRWW